MNAPVLLPIDDMEMYDELLPADVIRETEQRSLLIESNRKESLGASSQVQMNCTVAGDELGKLKIKLEEGVANFDRLTAASRHNAEMLFEAARILRAAAAKIGQPTQ